MQTESPQPEPTDLGKDVERAIEEFWLNCQQHGDPRKLPMMDCAPCRIAKEILENAIRARIDQPRPGAPSFEGTPLPTHECWCKDTNMNHRDCNRRGFHLCGCGATCASLGDRWIGGLAGRPVQRFQSTRAADIAGAAEPKPQHIFERTSKHNDHATIQRRRDALGLPWQGFLERYPEIERIGTPLAPGEEPSMTIITALQFKALAETVDMLVAERNAKL